MNRGPNNAFRTVSPTNIREMSPPPRHMPMNTSREEEYVQMNRPIPTNAVTSLSSDKISAKLSNRIEPPKGVDEILDELRSNTDEISEVLSQSSRPRKINIANKKRRRPKRNINLTIN